MHRKAVVLPHPEGPSSTRNSPSRTSSDSSWSAGLATASNVLVSRRRVTDAMFGSGGSVGCNAAWLLRLKRRDLPQQLGLVAAVPQLGLGVLPPDPPGAIDQDVGPLREELVLDQHPVGPGRDPLEIGQQVHLHRVLRFEFLQGRDRVDADRQDGGAGAREPVEILAEGAQLRRARRREGQWEECQQHVLAAAEARERDVRPRGPRQREIGGEVPNARAGPGGGGRRRRCHAPSVTWAIPYTSAAVTNPVTTTPCWLGQITRHTLNSIRVPNAAPLRIVIPQGSLQLARRRARIARPDRNVSAAAQRNHHSARGTSFCVATLLVEASASAKNGPCTKLK